MKEVYGDVWEYSADVICIPSNGYIKRPRRGDPHGRAVMGRGVAQQARDRFVDLDIEVASQIERFGNHVAWVRPEDPKLMIFPVKHNWWEEADPELIVRSAGELSEIATTNNWLTFVLPRPGCGNGQLKWEQVKPLIKDVLPDNVHVIERAMSPSDIRDFS